MGERKKIVFLQYSLRGGGAERKICTLANYFVSQGHEVEIGLFGRNIVAYHLDERVTVTFICRDTYHYRSRFEKWRYSLSVFFSKVFVYAPVRLAEKTARLFSVRFPASLSSHRVEAHYRKLYNYTQPIRSFVLNRRESVFITMMVQTYNGVMDIIGRDVESGRIKIPYIVMECSNPTPGLDASIEEDRKRNKYYPLASRCLVMTRGAKDYFAKEIRDKCIVIPNPVWDDLPAPYHGKRRYVVVSYCRFHKAKNLPLLINAFARFHQDFPDYRLEIHGQGEMENELKQRIAANRISNCAAVYSFDAGIHEKIKDCMMFVSSSDWEGFPNAVLEALSIGLPTIATDCDFGPRDMIDDHENGLLIPVCDVDAMVCAMKEIASDLEFAEKLSLNAARTREKYTVEKIGATWLDLIHEVAKENHR